MRFTSRVPVYALAVAGLAVCSQAALANVMYVAQNASGTTDGSSCANAYAEKFVNTPTNWGSGAKQIGPGTTVHLCGVITTPLNIYGSGASGNVITILWEPGARISVPSGLMVILAGSNGYLLFDGGIACGPGTTCDAVEAANQFGYAAGQAGIIEATANGSYLANQNITTQAFSGCNGCHDIEVRNLIIRNLYVHVSLSDATVSADSGPYTFNCSMSNTGCGPGTISIHDSTIHDNGNAIRLERANSTTFNVYNIDFYRNNWAMENSGQGTRTLNFHDNHIHDTANWDTTVDKFHHNGLHSYMLNASDSIAINFYNNLSDGNWGTCCTTALQLYTETSQPDNFNVFNNVAIQYPGNLAPAWEYAATNGVFANNTALGVLTTPRNVAAMQISGTGIDFQNNAVQGYGQYFWIPTGTTFTTFDYNQWGPSGISGNAKWAFGSVLANSFSAWKLACSCDSHGGNPAQLLVTSTGAPRAGSPLIGVGANLASLGLVPLNSATSAGSSVTTLLRPASTAWDAGAYQYFGSPGYLALQPPTGLTAVSH